MIQCAHCNKQIESMQPERVCPHCGGALSKPAPGNDLGKTIDAFSGTATIDLPASLDIVGDSSKTLGGVNGTIDMESNASLDIPKEVQSPSGKGITDVTVMTIDLPKEGTRDLELDAMTATIDSQGGSTLATGAFSMDSVAIPVTATIHLNAKDKTIGLDENAPVTPTVLRGKNAKTHVDPEVESPEESILKTISRRSLSRIDDRVMGSTPDYTIVKKLGEGGMGVVYAAIQKALDRKVAIKAIKSGVEVNFDAKKKFYYEARITGDLDHPNIVPIHEIGTQDDGTLFYSMKMVDGKPWQDAIGSRTRDENIEIFMKVCDAVAFAHSRNVIHRDLKPENVMIGAFGEVLVMDWGLAIQLPAQNSFSMSGTPAYMSPEMARHIVPKIGKGSDIYILGGILYEIITGHPPHGGKNVRECLLQAMNNQIVPSSVEDPLVDIARKALSTEVEDRYESVTKFQDAIREVLRHSESISLTRRAEEALELAEKTNDYEGFARSCFSMQEAIELWPENQSAVLGLGKAKLAYGKSALDCGDFDLCLQVLDPDNSEHASYREIARVRKETLLLRESRLRFTRRLLTGVILFATVALSVATYYASMQAAIARRAAEKERAAKEQETDAKTQAQASERIAVKALQETEEARKKEAEALDLARTEERNAREAERQAKENEKEARRNARAALLGTYQSNVTLSNSQAIGLETARSSAMIRDIGKIPNGWPVTDGGDSASSISSSSVELERSQVARMLDNWAIQRIRYYNNEDLARIHSDSKLTGIAFDRTSGRVAIGDIEGRLRFVRSSESELRWSDEPGVLIDGPMQHFSLSPDGKLLIASGVARESMSRTVMLSTETGRQSSVPGIEKRKLSSVAFSNDGVWLIGGINSGLWKWRVQGDSLSEPTVLPIRGDLKVLQPLEGKLEDFVFGFSQLPAAGSVCFIASLNGGNVVSIPLPPSVGKNVSTACMSPNGTTLLLGCTDGAVLPVPMMWSGLEEATGNLNVEVLKEEDFDSIIETHRSQRRHQSAVNQVLCDSDGTVLSRSDDPIIHVWQLRQSDRLVYDRFLSGLQSDVAGFCFVEGGDRIMGFDRQGVVMRWDRIEQERRRGSTLLKTPVSISSTGFGPANVPCVVDINGVILLGENAGSPGLRRGFTPHYLGHTPYSQVVDTACASKHSWVATSARRALESNFYLDKAQDRSEVCIWDMATGRMLARLSIPSDGPVRLGFIADDKELICGDGKSTWGVSTENWTLGAEEKRFGTVIASAHPLEGKLYALVNEYGSVRVLDSADPGSWDRERFRNFDLAINNRFQPVQAAWSTDGRRFYILFEHGRIARLTWDGTGFGGLDWSREFPELAVAEQELRWSYVDMDLSKAIDSADRLRFAVRSSDSKRKSKLSLLNWEHDSTQPKVVSYLEKTGDWHYLNAEEQALQFESVKSVGGLVKVQKSADGAIVLTDSRGVIELASHLGNENFANEPMGRGQCLDSVISKDGKMVLMRMDNQGLFAAEYLDPERGYSWSPIRHRFQTLQFIGISSNRQSICLIGTDKEHRSCACLVSKQDDLEWKVTLEVNDVRWAVPLANGEGWLFGADHGNAEIVEADASSWKRYPLEVEPGALSDTAQGLSAIWFAESMDGERGDASLLMLIRKVDGRESRIDWCRVDRDKRQLLRSDFSLANQSMIERASVSPKGNVFVVGDVSGTLSVWFATRRWDTQARELYSLPGHIGAKVTALEFSNDGTTLLSGDSDGRVIGWYTEAEDQ